MSEQLPDSYEDLLDDLKGILHSQIQQLKDSSKQGKLTVSENKTLLELIRQVKQLADEELAKAITMSDEQLIRISTKERVRKHRTRKNESLSDNSEPSTESPEESTGTETE